MILYQLNLPTGLISLAEWLLLIGDSLSTLLNRFTGLRIHTLAVLILFSTNTVLGHDATDSDNVCAGSNVTVINTPPQATPNANRTATVGMAFSYTVNAFTDLETPDNLTYSASINPANGLSFDASTRILSGTPTNSGVSSVSITATDAEGLSAGTSFSLIITCPTTLDYAALADLYNLTNGSTWKTKTNWLTNCNPCSWYGVGCTNGRVSSIDLSNNQLKGSIPVSLNALTELRGLYLNNNQLSGSLPDNLGTLTQLIIVFLDNNQLSGQIPTSLGSLSNLQWLNLSHNQLSGPILTNLNSLTTLSSIDLSYNQLSSLIPANLGTMGSLTNLYLNHNQLSGSIPASLGNLYNLQILSLDNNQLSGSIPGSLGEMPYLNTLTLNRNQLSGSIPGSMGYAMYNYYSIDLSYNQLSGSIPDSLGLGNLKDYLFELRLNNNRLTGNIPASLANLTNLHYLTLNTNQLSGCLPATLSALCGQIIDFANNPGLPGGGDFADFCASGTGTCPVLQSAPRPDLTPTLYIRPSTISNNTPAITAVVEVSELNEVAISGPVTIKITKDAMINLSFSASATSVDGRPVNNSDWTFSDSDEDYYVLTTSQPLAAGGSISVGLFGTLNLEATAGALTISAVLSGVLDEQKITNNTDAEKIEYFQR